ncbi:metal ABC transporter solute-binding protein, Zn/Mn family [Leptothoe spongobia]|uniref:Zinc ABC transporter substrate-binding protein n=1 Tax=Leptothoe spongobia TAU-MAC 1115 TaxID=1967444 RepID=A0A947DIZ3_9CYAN|nr:zinc ABC transporter substrate-binding protein [Leptothoe spongobia]MBT9317822.1 zinc ABC transporter substrate-binding protein [Leptothoe spongobia TAU-MAC 1115]
MSRLSFQRQVQQLSIMALGAIITLGGCTTSPTTTSEAEPSAAAPEDSLQVVTTFLPITQFTKAVAGDRAEVVQLLPTNVGPHDFQAKPSDIQAVANADVLVKNGLEMEFFLDDMIENAENSDLVTIDSSEEIAAFAGGEEEGHDDHAEEGHDDHGEEGHDDHAEEKAHDDHDEEGHDDHAEEKAHDDHDEEGHDDHAEEKAHAEVDDHGHAHGEFDPHIWLDPKRAIEQVENIRDGLIAADPEGESEYTANAAAFITELQVLDADITEMLSPFAGQTFVVFHDFAAYFASSYGLEAEVLVGLPEENPSPDDVKRVVDTVQAEGLKTIMTEPQAGDSSFKAIAQDLSIGVSEFDPLEVGLTEAVEPDYYLTTMRQNAENLANGFGASTQSWYPFWAPQPVAVINGWL